MKDVVGLCNAAEEQLRNYIIIFLTLSVLCFGILDQPSMRDLVNPIHPSKPLKPSILFPMSGYKTI